MNATIVRFGPTVGRKPGDARCHRRPRLLRALTLVRNAALALLLCAATSARADCSNALDPSDEENIPFFAAGVGLVAGAVLGGALGLGAWVVSGAPPELEETFLTSGVLTGVAGGSLGGALIGVLVLQTLKAQRQLLPPPSSAPPEDNSGTSTPAPPEQTGSEPSPLSSWARCAMRPA